MKSDKSIVIWIVLITAVAFGLLTIKSGGSVLFIDGIARKNAGNYVPFVVWFNFIAGFAYLLAGAGIFMQKRWAVWISIFIVIATIVAFAILELHILNGGLYQVRTIGAMILRIVVWTLIAMFTYRKFITRKK